MAGFSTLSGTVSHVSATSFVQGAVKNGKGRVSTAHKTDFRVDGKAAYISAAVNIADGDHVTLVGDLKGGELRARALRNDETGVVYSGPTGLLYFLGGLLVLIGIPALLILVGLIIVPIGAWFIFQGYMNQSAIKVLQGTS